MKLLYLHQYFKTPDMAGGTRSFEFARRLVKSGHEVHIISSWTEPTDQVGWFEQNIEGIHVHWLPILYSNHMGFASRIKAFASFAFKAGSRARAIGGDVVFATSTPLTIAVPGVRTAKKLRVPFVFEVRDLWPEMPIATGALRHPLLKAIARRLERYAYFNADHIVALSPTMKDGVLKVRSGVDISVIPNSCDLDLFDLSKPLAGCFLDQHPELKGVPIVSYAGTFGEINGVDYLTHIAAAAAARGSKIQFLAVGDGAKLEFVRSEAARLGVLNKNFFLYDQISKRDVPALMAATSLPLSLFANIKEMEANSANKFFDALASGNPVGINYGGWQSELVEKYGIGLVLPPNDPDAAAKVIIDFLADPLKVSAAGERARLLGEEMFSRDNLAIQLEKILTNAIETAR